MDVLAFNQCHITRVDVLINPIRACLHGALPSSFAWVLHFSDMQRLAVETLARMHCPGADQTMQLGGHHCTSCLLELCLARQTTWASV